MRFHKLSLLKLVLTAFILTVLIMISCQKPGKNLSWESDILDPLIHSSLGVDDIFTDSLLVENPDQSFKLVLDQKINTMDNNALIEVHDTIAEDVFNVNIPVPFKLNPGQKILEKNTDFMMKLGDVRLSKAKAKKAILKFLVISNFKQPMRVKYKVLSSEKNSIPFEITDDIPAAAAGSEVKLIREIDLSGYNIDFTGLNHNSINTIRSSTTIWISPNADTAYYSKADSITVTSIFDKLQLESALGYFGQKNQMIADSSILNTFQNFKSGSFSLENLSAELQINNYVGADFQVRINKITSANSSTGKQLDLNDAIVGRRLNILRASRTSDDISSITPQKYTYSLNNSNVKDLLMNMPDKLSYQIEYNINPLGNVSGGNDFIFADKSLEGNIHIEIPLKVKMDSLVIQSYSKINFDSESHIKSGYLNIYVANLFPFDVEIQFYVLDDHKNIVDSLLKENSISRHGTIDNNGIVIKATNDILRVKLDAELIQKLKTSKEVLIWARINNPQQKHYLLYQNYNIDIKLIVEANYEY